MGRAKSTPNSLDVRRARSRTASLLLRLTTLLAGERLWRSNSRITTIGITTRTSSEVGIRAFQSSSSNGSSWWSKTLVSGTRTEDEYDFGMALHRVSRSFRDWSRDVERPHPIGQLALINPSMSEWPSPACNCSSVS